MSPRSAPGAAAPVDRPSRRPRAAVLAGAVVALLAAAPAVAAPPPAPGDLVLTPAGPTRATSVTATWTVPAGAEATTARWELCPLSGAQTERPSGPDCATGTSATPGAATIPTPGQGRFAATVRLVDADAAEGPAAAAAPLTVDRTAPAAPGLGLGPAGKVTWAAPVDAGSPLVLAHWEVCQSYEPASGPPACTTGTTQDHEVDLRPAGLVLPPPVAYCSAVRTTASVWLEDAAGNGHSANRGVATFVVSPPCPARGPGTGGLGPVTTATGAPAARRPARMTVGARWRAGRRATSRRVVLTVAVTPKDAPGVVRLRLTGTRYARTVSATVRGGRATVAVTVPARVRRLRVRAALPAAPTRAAATATVVSRLPVR